MEDKISETARAVANFAATGSDRARRYVGYSIMITAADVRSAA